ncbi:MAG: hypothetical protein ACI90V_013344 [Bacillariaceae sp.]|jgi:hypothetical protein
MSQEGRSRRSSYVLPTSIKDGRVSKTAAVDRHSTDDEDIQKSMLFHKRVYGLLVLQYTTILIISSPLALLPNVQQYLSSVPLLHTVLECIAIGGIISTMIVAILFGSKYPNSHVCLFSITIFVGLEMGLSFTNNIGLYIAIGQATTSFALILAMQQFDFLWFDYPKAVGMSCIAALIWTLILIEQGKYSIMTSFSIGAMGFAFVCIVLCSSYTVEHHVSPEEYVLATLFILCPEALLCVGGAKKRRNVDADIIADEESDLFLNAES